MLICRNYFLILIVVVLSLLSWQHMIYQARTLSEFGDETVNVQSAVSFFESGRYQNSVDGLVYSSGIAVTWPAALGWFLGKNMLASRLSCAFFSWFFAMVLGFYFFRKQGYTNIGSAIISACLWSFMLTSPFAMPYWFGFLYNLGELNSIIIIGFGLLVIARNPFLSAFLFGIAIWHGKLIYFPFVSSVLLSNLLVQKLPVRKTIMTAGWYIIIFLLPLLIWLGWVSLRVDVATMKQWFSVQSRWLDHMNKMHGMTLLSGAEISPLGLWDRLNSSQLEWAGYSIGTKAKNLFFSFGAIGLTIASLVAVRTGKLHITKRETWFSLMAIIAIGFYCFWYFFIHHYMWQRHFQPAIYIGFGLFIFWGSKWGRQYPMRSIPVFYAAMILLFAVQVVEWIKPLL